MLIIYSTQWTECSLNKGINIDNIINPVLLLQVESFVLLLRALLTEQKPYRLVDFGSGTGNLLLPLAALFPWCTFHAVEMKPNAVSLLLSRAAAAGLTNVTAEVFPTLKSWLLFSCAVTSSETLLLDKLSRNQLVYAHA